MSSRGLPMPKRIPSLTILRYEERIEERSELSVRYSKKELRRRGGISPFFSPFSIYKLLGRR
jgi:hypothetical protein